MSEKLDMPSPREVLDAIEKWRKLDLRKKSRDQIQRKFEELFFEIICGVTSKGISGAKTFYRIREMDYLFEHTKELWAPPIKHTKKGRCNFDGEPMLYTAFDGVTCLEELDVDAGKQVYMIKYKKIMTESLNLRWIYSKSSDLNNKGEELFGSEGLIAYQIIREFLRAEFTKPTCNKCDGSDYIYNVSATMSHFMTIQKSNLDGLVYSSVAKPDHENVAFFPERAKEKLKVEDVRILKVIPEEQWYADARVNSSWNPILRGKTHYTQCCFKADIDEDKEEITWVPCTDLGAF